MLDFNLIWDAIDNIVDEQNRLDSTGESNKYPEYYKSCINAHNALLNLTGLFCDIYEYDQELDKDLYKVIYNREELPEGLTYEKAISVALKNAILKENTILDELIEVPSREKFNEWIQLAEEKRNKK